jgi:hypothetical protein
MMYVNTKVFKDMLKQCLIGVKPVSKREYFLTKVWTAFYALLENTNWTGLKMTVFKAVERKDAEIAEIHEKHKEIERQRDAERRKMLDLIEDEKERAQKAIKEMLAYQEDAKITREMLNAIRTSNNDETEERRATEAKMQ